jgi:hypothetical protein
VVRWAASAGAAPAIAAVVTRVTTAMVVAIRRITFS